MYKFDPEIPVDTNQRYVQPSQFTTRLIKLLDYFAVPGKGGLSVVPQGKDGKGIIELKLHEGLSRKVVEAIVAELSLGGIDADLDLSNYPEVPDTGGFYGFDQSQEQQEKPGQTA